MGSTARVPGTRTLLALALVAATAVAYEPTRRAGFVNFDDDVYVTENAQVRAGLTGHGARQAFSLRPAGRNFYFQPLTWLSLMLDRELFGLEPAPFHRTNLALHAANCVLLFLLLARTTGATWPSAVAAALFGLHPLCVESVAWIVERKNVLSLFFGLLSLHAFAWYAEGRTPLRYTASLGLLALSLLAKPLLVTMGLLVVLVDLWPLDRWGRPERDGKLTRLLLEAVPFLALGALSVAVAQVSLHSAGIVEPVSVRPMGLRLANALVSYPIYLAQTVWPTGLAVYYPFPDAVPAWQALASAAGLASVTAVAWRARRSHPHLLVGWLWFAGTLLPMAGLVQAGLWPARADRFMYLPLIGLAIAAAWSGACWVESRPRWRLPVTAVAAAGLAALGLATRAQASHWLDSVALFRHANAVTGGAAVIYNNLGSTYVKLGQPGRAVAEFEAAIRLDPAHVTAYTGLAQAYAALGRNQEARGALAALERLEPGRATRHVELGNLFLGEGRLDEAIVEYQAAVAAEPLLPGAQFNLGEAYRRKGRLADAAVHLERALAQDPGLARPLLPLAEISASSGRVEEALALYERALSAGAGDATTELRVGSLYGQLKRLPQAVNHLEAAVRLAPGSSEARNNLGNAYRLSGRSRRAREQYRLAVALDPTNAQARENLARLESGEGAEGR
jgi:tetratricopeptide (TPR) repeat protein